MGESAVPPGSCRSGNRSGLTRRAGSQHSGFRLPSLGVLPHSAGAIVCAIGAMNRGAGGGSDGGPDLSKLLEQFLPKKEDVAQNGIEQYGARGPASENDSLLSKDTDIFKRIHDAYQEKQFSVKAVIGGKERTFLFDTGEGITMISPSAVVSKERSGCSAQNVANSSSVIG